MLSGDCSTAVDNSFAPKSVTVVSIPMPNRTLFLVCNRLTCQSSSLKRCSSRATVATGRYNGWLLSFKIFYHSESGSNRQWDSPNRFE